MCTFWTGPVEWYLKISKTGFPKRVPVKIWCDWCTKNHSLWTRLMTHCNEQVPVKLMGKGIHWMTHQIFHCHQDGWRGRGEEKEKNWKFFCFGCVFLFNGFFSFPFCSCFCFLIFLLLFSFVEGCNRDYGGVWWDQRWTELGYMM